jgi:arylsulfatase A-like enzyme
VVRADENDPARALTNASTMLVRGRYKLLYYFGYEDKGVQDFTRLYDVEADPQELVDLSRVEKELAGSLLNELKAKLAEVNKPYL